MKHVKVDGILGEHSKEYIMRVIRMRSKQPVDCDMNGFIFTVMPDDTYDDVLSKFRLNMTQNVYYEKLYAKIQTNIDEMIGLLPSIIDSLDDFIGWLAVYSSESYNTGIQTRRWKLMKILIDAGYTPKQTNLGSVPIQLLTLQMVVEKMMHNLIENDFCNSTKHHLENYTLSPHYKMLKKSMDRKKTIDDLLKTI